MTVIQPSGSSAPTPCTGGTYNEASGSSDNSACTPVTHGWWAPTGSAERKPCPASGFRCPGAANDAVNDPPGSLPILIEVGARKEGCSCLYGNPCQDQYVCQNWANRFEVAKKNGWKGF